MKVTQKKTVIQSHGGGAATAFRIEASAHAFQMLSSGLYSDKKSAVLREVGCNAADAHAAAGKRHVPFEVKLPTDLDSDFYIQNWGPGLDEQEVRQLYTTYFKSTKQDSNDFTGAFGLGSKSPYSYTDSFSVIACKDGVQRSFVAYLLDGNPVIKIVAEQPVSKHWKTGVRVGFPVKRADFDEFRAKAVQVFQWFKPLPIIKGLPENWAPENAYWFDGDRISIASTMPWNSKTQVVMGNVAYPLDLKEVFPGSASTGGILFYQPNAVQTQSPEERLAHFGVVLKLPIGAVQVAASREVLQYSSSTRDALDEALRLAVLDIEDHVEERLYRVWKDHSGWARRVAAQTELGLLPNVLADYCNREVPHRLMAKGVPSGDAMALCTVGDNGVVPGWVTTSRESGITVKFVPATDRQKAKAYIVHDGEYARTTEDIRQAQLRCHPETRIYIGDVEQPESRVISGARRGDSLLVMQRGKDKKEAECIARRIADELGGVPVVPVSSLPCVLQKTGEKGRTKVDVLNFVNYAQHSGVDRWLGGADSTALDEVPEECRYFLVRDGAPGAQKTMHHVDWLDDEGKLHRHAGVDWETVANAIVRFPTVLRSLGLDNQFAAEGFILVPPTAVARLDLLERGFLPILDEFRKVTQTPLFKKALKLKGVAGMPFTDYATEATNAFANRFVSSETGFAAALKDTMCPDIAAYIQSIQTQRVAETVATLRSDLERVIGGLWNFFGLEAEVFTSREQVRERLEAAYPALAIVDYRKMRDGKLEDLLPALKSILSATPTLAPVKLAA